MKWRVLTAAGIIAAVLLGGVYCRHLVEAHCGQIEGLLQQLSAQLDGEGEPDPALLEQAEALWERRLWLLSSLVNQEHLEEVGRSIALAEGYLRHGDKAGCRAQVDAALYLLDDIREYDKIDLKTVL